MVKPIGRVTAIYRYPVKSMGGESLRSATLRWQGIDGDRQYTASFAPPTRPVFLGLLAGTCRHW